MSIAEATPDLEVEPTDRNDRAFLGHPKGLGYLAFVEGCERFSYYSMQTLLTLYMVNYLLIPGRLENVVGLEWLRVNHYDGLSGQPLSSAIFGDLYVSVSPSSAACRCGSPVPPHQMSPRGFEASALSCA